MKSLNESSLYSPASPKWTPDHWVGYNKCKISGSRQCILCEGKLVTVLVQLTLRKIIIHNFNIYFRQSTWECQDCQEQFARILLKWDMDIGKILFTVSYVKYKQFHFSLLVNEIEIYRKKSIFFNIMPISGSFVSNLKWRGCFYLQFISFSSYITMSMGRGRRRNKLLYKEALPQAQNPITELYRVFFTGKAFLSYVYI